MHGDIAPTKDEALDFIQSNTTHPPPHTYISASDGSHHPGKGAGAATVVCNAEDPATWPILLVRVGDADVTTPYQAELAGFELAVASAKQSAPQGTKFFWFLTDNQTLIRDLTEPLRVKAGMLTCLRIRENLHQLSHRFPGSRVAIIWCPSKNDVPGMQRADAAEKAAATLRQIIAQPPPPHPPAILRRIKEQVVGAAKAPPTGCFQP